MDTKETASDTTGWWNCAGCSIDAEIIGAGLAGCETPCPDCDEPMVQWVRWETVAA